MCTVKIYPLVVCQGRLKSLVETLRDQSLFIGGGGGGGGAEEKIVGTQLPRHVWDGVKGYMGMTKNRSHLLL
jgi:hypothetical protein